MKIVEFKEPYPPYAPGDVAGIDDKVAAELIKQGVCVAHAAKEVGKPEVDKMVKRAKVSK